MRIPKIDRNKQGGRVNQKQVFMNYSIYIISVSCN